jgi:hypothetical protein
VCLDSWNRVKFLWMHVTVLPLGMLSLRTLSYDSAPIGHPSMPGRTRCHLPWLWS